MSLLAHIADHALNVPLAILPRKAAAIIAVLGGRIGLEGDMTAFARSVPGPKMALRQNSPISTADYVKTDSGVALISIVGTLVNRGAYLEAESGLKSFDTIKRQIRSADADKDVTSILLDLHTPGGEAAGCFECADVIHAISRGRPVSAVINSMACSAGYALAAAANKIIISPSGLCGSIGVVCIHSDFSRQIDARGITPTMIYAGAHKVDGNQIQPLSDEVRNDIQAEVDTYYDLFVKGVAKHRLKLTEAAIRKTEARTYIGANAVRVGLADEIGTLETAIAELSRLHPVATAPFNRTEFIYGKAEATKELLDRERAAGVRAGMAAALAGRT
jgi:capsid assembly protease